MSRRGSVVLARYVALQVPGMFFAGLVLMLLVHWGQLTPRVGWILFGLWVAKDVVMYPITRMAYATGGGHHGTEVLVGATARAQEEIRPGAAGYVRLGAELWRAVLDGDEPVPAGGRARVVRVENLTLHVRPEEP